MSEVREIYLAAWRAKLKGITVYRYGSREGQVLTSAEDFRGGCAGKTCTY